MSNPSPQSETELEAFLKEFGEAHDRAVDWLNESCKYPMGSRDYKIAILQYEKAKEVCSEILERVNNL